MFKVLVVSALFMVMAMEAANLACKSEANDSVDGTCPEGTTLIDDSCCPKADVFDVDAHTCKSAPLPAIDRNCPFGFILVAGDGCCPNSDAVSVEKKN